MSSELTHSDSVARKWATPTTSFGGEFQFLFSKVEEVKGECFFPGANKAAFRVSFHSPFAVPSHSALHYNTDDVRAMRRNVALVT